MVMTLHGPTVLHSLAASSRLDSNRYCLIDCTADSTAVEGGKRVGYIIDSPRTNPYCGAIETIIGTIVYFLLLVGRCACFVEMNFTVW